MGQYLVAATALFALTAASSPCEALQVTLVIDTAIATVTSVMLSDVPSEAAPAVQENKSATMTTREEMEKEKQTVITTRETEANRNK